MNSSSDEKSFYQRYCAQCIRFERAGILLVGGAVALDILTHHALYVLSLIIFTPGTVLLILGGSCHRPHNAIKSFARQCIQDSSEDFAQGLLDALEAHSSIQLTKPSISLVENAIECYSKSEGADPELVSKLKTAVETRVRRKVF